MTTELKHIYRCDYCRKVYQLERFAEKHEKKCYKNPANDRPCYGCSALSKKSITTYDDDPYHGEVSWSVDLFFCSKKNVCLYPPSVTLKGNKIETGDYENIEMPTECDLFTEKDFTL